MIMQGAQYTAKTLLLPWNDRCYW